MVTESSQIFRITYEAFSKFSNNLNRCREFEEIARCFTVNLKYMFNYHVFRASYFRNGAYIHLQSVAGHTSMSVRTEPAYLDYELLLFNQSIPRRWTDLQVLKLPGSFANVDDDQQELWGWNFINDERQIIISVLSGGKKKFTQKDINFLKLVSENLETKLLELCLIKELDAKNNIISKINEDQKLIISERTKEIAEKNKTLLEISVLNAHNVREPLARILGLINLMSGEESDEWIVQALPLLKSSASDLDDALQNVINYSTKDLLELKA